MQINLTVLIVNRYAVVYMNMSVCNECNDKAHHINDMK